MREERRHDVAAVALLLLIVARTTTESSNGATIDVEARGRAFLVMSVTPHRYWRVLIDDVRVTPIVTNIGYQGVEVPPGLHRVTMRYANPVVIVSAFASLAMLAVLLWLLAASHSDHSTLRAVECDSGHMK